MTELEPYAPGELVSFKPSLTERAKDLAAAYQFGEALAETSFVPAAFRGRPEEAAAAILCGDEVGLSPMQSLRAVYVISGTPAMYARAMVALVLSHGHEVWTEEDTPAKVVVCGRRKGSSQVERITWTTERARTAGYANNKKYQTDPQAMLYARASSDVCRRIAPDVLLGLAYSVEEVELSDEPTTTVVREGAPKKVTRRKAEPPSTPEPDFDGPKPMERGRDNTLRHVEDVALPPPLKEEPIDAEIVEDEQSASEPVKDRPGYITRAQLRMLHALLGEAGLGKDRDAALTFCSEVGGRRVESSKDLTRVEFERIRVRLVEMTAPAEDDPEPGFDDEPAPNEFVQLPYKDD